MYRCRAFSLGLRVVVGLGHEPGHVNIRFNKIILNLMMNFFEFKFTF